MFMNTDVFPFWTATKFIESKKYISDILSVLFFFFGLNGKITTVQSPSSKPGRDQWAGMYME